MKLGEAIFRNAKRKMGYDVPMYPCQMQGVDITKENYDLHFPRIMDCLSWHGDSILKGVSAWIDKSWEKLSKISYRLTEEGFLISGLSKDKSHYFSVIYVCNEKMPEVAQNFLTHAIYALGREDAAGVEIFAPPGKEKLQNLVNHVSHRNGPLKFFHGITHPFVTSNCGIYSIPQKHGDVYPSDAIRLLVYNTPVGKNKTAVVIEGVLDQSSKAK